MKVAVFSTKVYDRRSLDEVNKGFQQELCYFEARLNSETVTLAKGYPVVCVFVNDVLDQVTLEKLSEGGTKVIALRCAGFNNVDLVTAENLGIKVVRVPSYSPYAVAEHALALILALNRKIHRAHNRVRENNFSLEGLLGFDLNGSVVGVIGTGKIGAIFAKIMQGFGCQVLAYDCFQNQTCLDLGVEYANLKQLFEKSDIISLHCPLTPETYHLINQEAIAHMKKGVMIINTSRGALVDAQALIEGLKSEHIGYLGLDVYEEESDLFFEDLSGKVLHDDVFARLMTFSNVLVTGHQAFFTQEALENIATTTLLNIQTLDEGLDCINQVKPPRV